MPIARQRSVNCVGKQVDKHLLQLIGIGSQQRRRAWIELNREPLFEKDDALKQWASLHRTQARRRQLRKLPVGLDKAVQCFCTALDDTEAASIVAQSSFVS